MEFYLQRQPKSPSCEGKTRTLTPPINLLPCESVFKVIGQGKKGEILDSLSMAFAILNGSLTPSLARLQILTVYACHVIFMRPDYERLTVDT